MLKQGAKFYSEEVAPLAPDASFVELFGHLVLNFCFNVLVELSKSFRLYRLARRFDLTRILVLETNDLVACLGVFDEMIKLDLQRGLATCARH